MNNLILRIFVLMAAVAQIATPVFVNPFREGHNAFRSGVPSQIEPAGYAFSIWGPIYLLALAYSVWQLTPAGRADLITGRIAPMAIVVYVGSSLWLYFAKYGPFWVTMPILVAMATCASVAYVQAASGSHTFSLRWWMVILPFGLYAGWTTCATFVNIAEVAPAYGFQRFGLSIPAYGVLSILAALVVATIVLSRCDGDFAFAATVVWALVAIIVASRQRGTDVSIQYAAAFGIVAVMMLTAWFRGRRRGAIAS